MLGVCGSGVCMMSCGVDADTRSLDLDMVLNNQSVSSSQGDNTLCPPCKTLAEDKTMAVDDDTNIINFEESLSYDAKPQMVRIGMLITIIIFLLIGLLFTFINIVMTVLNIAHNPVSSIMGIDGLVLWNFIAGRVKGSSS